MTDTETAPTEAPNATPETDAEKLARLQSEFEAFKTRVVREAIRVKNQQDWCEDGVNETMRNLGLPNIPRRRAFTFEVPATAVARYSANAYSEDEALATIKPWVDDDRARLARGRPIANGSMTTKTLGDVIVTVTS